MLRVLTIIFLFVFSFNSYATDLQVRNGKLSYPLTKEFNENGFRAWKVIGGGIEQEYQARFDKSLHVKEASTGLRSLSTVPVTIEARVSRKAVLSGAFGLVKAGAKLGLKAVPYVGAASYAYDAYKLINPTLESAGYHYSANADAYLKVYDNALCLDKFMSEPGYYSCVGVDSSVMLALSKGGKSGKDAQTLLTMQVQSDYEKIHKGLMDRYYGDEYSKTSPKCRWNGWGVSCDIQTLALAYRFINNYSEELTPDKFLGIATNKIDSNPTPFIEGTGRPEYNEKVSVPAGTVVTIGPVTPENGKPVQITITFGQDSNGNSTAKVETTPRPDLIPGSPAAPKTNPTPTPGENGKPGSQPDPTPDGSPSDKPKPDPDDSPSGKDNPKPDDKPDPDGKDDPKKDERPKEDDKPKEDGGLLCKVFPNILACDELPEKEEPDLEIPEEQIDLNFTPDNTFKEYGECPAPVMFQALGAEYKISLEPACNLAAMMRPFIIAMAWLVASFFVARVVRNNA